MLRYLPLSIATTGAVVVLPTVLVAVVLPSRGADVALLSAALAVAASIAFAAAWAWAWKRQPRSRDLVFAELMLWSWARRYLTERRLSQARVLFDQARLAGPHVKVELLIGLSRLLQARDVYVHGHSRRVARNAVRIASGLGVSKEQTAKIRVAAEIHDIGKLYTPRSILNNPRKLTDAEFEVIKRHALDGAEMVSVVGDPEITSMVRHHHERIDGHGYPDGLSGDEIPLGARIIAVADTFDAITSTRPYRSAGAQRKALEVISAEAGKQLDADAVAVYLRSYSARRPVAWVALALTALERGILALQSAASNVGLSSLGGVLPAVGAAGALALSPGLFKVDREPLRSGPFSGGSSLAALAGGSAPGGVSFGNAGGKAGAPRRRAAFGSHVPRAP